MWNAKVTNDSSDDFNELASSNIPSLNPMGFDCTNYESPRDILAKQVRVFAHQPWHKLLLRPISDGRISKSD